MAKSLLSFMCPPPPPISGSGSFSEWVCSSAEAIPQAWWGSTSGRLFCRKNWDPFFPLPHGFAFAISQPPSPAIQLKSLSLLALSAFLVFPLSRLPPATPTVRFNLVCENSRDAAISPTTGPAREEGATAPSVGGRSCERAHGQAGGSPPLLLGSERWPGSPSGFFNLVPSKCSLV